MHLRIITYLSFTLLLTACQPQPKGKHLFILSGQSNMVRINVDSSFTPTLEAAFGAENTIIVKSAQSGQPIKRWYRDWQLPDTTFINTEHDLYDTLMVKVNQAIERERIATVTLVWMQGERDARQSWGDVYEASLLGLYQQLSDDLGRSDVNFVIGRLSDFDLANKRYPHWTKVREAHEKVADSAPNFTWINTDDLNDGLNKQGKVIKNDLHLSEPGYDTLGKRFALAAIRLIDAQ